MITVYDPALKATVLRDDNDRLRAINHLDEFPPSDQSTAIEAALAYIREAAPAFAFGADELRHAAEPLSYLQPDDAADHEFRLRDEKASFDTVTTVFNQTWVNVPVWEAGLTVTMKRAPWRAVAATSTMAEGVDAAMPSADAIARFRALFATAEKSDQPQRGPGSEPPDASHISDDLPEAVVRLLGLAPAASDNDGAAVTNDNAVRSRATGLIRGRFYVYQFDPHARLEQRSDGSPNAPGQPPESPHLHGDDQPLCGAPPRFPGPIPPVPTESVQSGRWYMVAELIFRRPLQDGGRMNWRALVEVESGAVLYLRALTSGITGQVFQHDPITATGNTGLTPNQNAATLNPSRSSRTLNHLNAPSGGVQALAGTRNFVTETSAPTVASPSRPSGSNFDYSSRSNDFAAVNAYYHTDRFFDLVESLGFTLSTYFNGTTFPIETDHRGLGTAINAQCIGDGDGIDFHQYALCDTADTTNPIGIATDWRVVLHELGGHGILYDHVGRANFGAFTNSMGVLVNRAHSFGDSFAVVLNDFNSSVHTGAAVDRFLLAPFVPAIVRRSDRTVAAGWGWGGAQDLGNYSSEQILSTTMFRIYRSVGGDAADLGRREFAARLTAYLMLRAVSTLTPVSNPNTPQGILAALLAADAGDWLSEGLAGGAYGKVLTWAFERQNLNGGARPAVDVYINDGRGGEYPYQPVFWQNGSVWNRRSPDGGMAHEEAGVGVPNYAYCKVRNRGTSVANNAIVRGYHCLPSAGVTWPVDLQPMTTASINVGTIAANDGEEKIVGPFTWTPNPNAWGHDCMFMIASATGDPSNIDNLSAGEVFADWRLVPHDNNIGQRNVNLVAAGGGIAGIMASLNGKGFWLGNPNRKSARVTATIALPAAMQRLGWSITIPELSGGALRLKPGERRLVTYAVRPGSEIGHEVIASAEDRDIVVTATADGAIIGGMSYRLDPELKVPFNEQPKPERKTKCRDKAQELLECLELGASRVGKVRVRKIEIDVDLEDDCGC